MNEQVTGLAEMLKHATSQEDKDIDYIVAGVLNLYHVAMIRRAGRKHFLTDDVPNLSTIIGVLLGVTSLERQLTDFAPKPGSVEHREHV